MPEQFRRDGTGNWERDTRSDSYIPANPRFLMATPGALRQMGGVAKLQLALYRGLGLPGIGLLALASPNVFAPFLGLPFSTHAVLTALLALIAGTSGFYAEAATKPSLLTSAALYCFAAGSLVLAYGVRRRRIASLALARNVLLGLLLFYALRAAIEMLDVTVAGVANYGDFGTLLILLWGTLMTYFMTSLLRNEFAESPATPDEHLDMNAPLPDDTRPILHDERPLPMIGAIAFGASALLALVSLVFPLG
jgi:hypothetical protein